MLVQYLGDCPKCNFKNLRTCNLHFPKNVSCIGSTHYFFGGPQKCTRTFSRLQNHWENKQMNYCIFQVPTCIPEKCKLHFPEAPPNNLVGILLVGFLIFVNSVCLPKTMGSYGFCRSAKNILLQIATKKCTNKPYGKDLLHVRSQGNLSFAWFINVRDLSQLSLNSHS